MISIHKCPICKGTDIRQVYNCTDYTVSKKQFDIKECTSCTFRFTSPRPNDSDLGQYYLSADYISHNNEAKKLVDKIYLIARSYTLQWKRKLIDTINNDPSAKRLLDYGCGTGSFLNHMSRNGWTTTGLEPSVQARKVAEQQTGQKIYSDITDITQDQFEIVTLWHVLEHIPQLHQTIEQLKALLTANGKLIIAVPNHKSLEANKFKEHWAGYDVPRHLCHFNQATMNKLMIQHGLRIASIVPMKLDSYYISLLSQKYLNNNYPSILHLPKAVMMGFRSNLAARTNNEYSSLIYVISK